MTDKLIVFKFTINKQELVFLFFLKGFIKERYNIWYIVVFQEFFRTSSFIYLLLPSDYLSFIVHLPMFFFIPIVLHIFSSIFRYDNI
jgi:hypothetical protein